MAANALLTVHGITCPRRPPDYPEIVTFFSTLAGTSANWRGAFGLPLPVHVGRPLQPPPDAMLLLLEPLCLRTAGAPQPGLSTGKGRALYVRATYLRPANFSGASRLSSAQSSLTRTSRNQTEVLPTSRPLPVGGGESCRGGHRSLADQSSWMDIRLRANFQRYFRPSCAFNTGRPRAGLRRSARRLPVNPTLRQKKRNSME